MSVFATMMQPSPSTPRRARRGRATTRLRRAGSGLLCGIAVLCVASTAHAGRDVCLQSSFGETLVFRNVPVLKPGRSVALTGIYLNLVTTIISVPFDGSAMMSGDGATVRIGIFVHEMGAPPLHNFTFEWTAADTTFAGSGFYDSNADYLADGPVSFFALPSTTCRMINVP
jgi:hypothetical protein